MRVAAITKPELNTEIWDKFYRVIGEKPEDFEGRDWTEMSRLSDKLLDIYLDQVGQAVDLGARIVFLQEAGLPVMDFDEEAAIGKASEFTAARGVYLGLAMMVFPTDLVDYYTASSVYPYNKVVLVGPEDTVLGEYVKHNAIPSVEMIETGDGPVPALETPYGRVGFLICFDMDHHELLGMRREQTSYSTPPMTGPRWIPSTPTWLPSTGLPTATLWSAPRCGA